MQRTIYYTTISLLLLLLHACSFHREEEEGARASYTQQDSTTAYARHFHIGYQGDSIYIQTSQDSESTPRGSFSFSREQPPERIICLSTTHLPFITTLGQQDHIVGIGSMHYVYNKAQFTNIPAEVGHEPHINFETILTLQPDLVLAYSIEGESASHINKLQQLGIPVLLIHEHLEPHPLGRTEWIRVYGALFGEEEQADSLFNVIEAQYQSVKAKGQAQRNKPGVLIGLPFKGVWYMPGGNSYFAQLVADAGGHYLFRSLSQQQESIIVPFEKILTHKDEANIWINTGTAENYKQILDTDHRLAHLDAFQSKKIYNNNARVSRHGGNDFWESGLMKPHIILQDLFSVFHLHGNSTSGDTLFYYKALPE